MEDGQATAGLVFTLQGRDSSFVHHQEMQGKELKTQNRVRTLMELLGFEPALGSVVSWSPGCQ